MHSRPGRLIIRHLLYCVALTFWLGEVFGALAADDGKFSIESWQSDKGLPQNFVTAIFQGRDGYIWLGTYNGLVRFDGVRFVVFDSVNSPGLKNSRITSLYQASDNAIWIGHESGDVSCLRNGRFTNSSTPRDWPGEEIVGLSQDEQGDVWALSNHGRLLRLRDQKVLSPPVPLKSASVAHPSFNDQGNGQLFVLFLGAVASIHNGELVPVAFDDLKGAKYIERVCSSRDGGQWVIGQERIRKWKQNSWVQDFGSYPYSHAFITAACETRSGMLCVGTLESGLFILKSGMPTLHFSHTNGLPHDWVRCMTEDHEGNLWVGTSGGGLCVLRSTKVTMHSPPDDWESRGVLSVTRSQNGDLWAGTEGAGLYRLSAGRWQQYGTKNGLPNRFIWSVLEDRVGNLWVGTWGNGLFKREGEKFVPASGFQPSKVQVTALYEGKDGALWAGTGAGLLRYQNNTVTKYGHNEGVTLLDIRTITQSSDGSVWFGTMGGGLGCLRDGHIMTYARQDGLCSDSILSLYFDSENTLWVGTPDAGLSRMKNGRFKTISADNGLANNVIGHIAGDDANGWLWLSSQAGILRVSKAELNRCADGLSQSVECLIYGKNQGLSTVACSGGFQPSGVQTADGHLWIPTGKGLAEVDLRLLEKNVFPPPVCIESADICGQLTPIVNLTASASNGLIAIHTLTIPPDKQRLSLKFTALSYIDPEAVRFRYRLAPLETDWVEGGTRRSVDYSYVPPGEYQFSVMACNNDGVWNQTGDSLRVIVQPHYWQTAWFKISVSAAGILAIAGTVFVLTRHRERRKLARLKQEAALERERTRIAQDIHDDLGASLTRMTMLSHSAMDESGTLPELNATLNQIHLTAREVTRSMDEIVWAVNPRHDSLDSLANYLGRFAQTFLAAADIRCRLDLPLDIPPLPLTAEMRHNIFLAFKESVNNIVRHSKATEVTIELQIREAELRLLIRDNGSGFKLPEAFTRTGRFEAEARISKGNGLLNIHRRMSEVGGHCHIESQPGTGTKVELLANLK